MMRSRTKKPNNMTIYKSGTKGPRLLPLKKAAEYLGLTVWSMRETIWAGDIPVIRFPGGRKMFIDVLDLEDFIKRNKEVFR